MSSPNDPCGKIYTILSEERAAFLWFFEPVFIPQEFREHLVLVLGWTTGRRGYASIITPSVPDGANPDYYIRIRAPSRRAAASDSTVTLRKNKTFSALVEHSHVRLDWVWEVPFAILLGVPRVGMQLMLRAVSMEKLMGFYARWGWDQAWGQTYRSRPQCPQWAGFCHDQKSSEPPGSIWQGGVAGCPQLTRRPCQAVDGLASSRIPEQDRDTEDKALTGSDDGENRHLGEGNSPCAGQEMVYAGDAHCTMLAKLLREAR